MSSKKTLAKIEARRAEIMPLDDFPEQKRSQILAQVAAPRPPGRWIYFGAAGYDGPPYRPLASMPSRAWYEWHWARGVDPDAKGRRLSESMRQRVIARDGYICQLCSTPVEPDDVHIDHIIPWSIGGPDTLENLQVTHSRCNLIKGARV